MTLRIMTAWLTILLLTGCFGLPERVEYPLPPQNKNMTWQEIRSQAGILSFRVLNTGQVRVPVSGILDGYDTWPVNGESSRWGDVYAFLLHHPVHGNILIDSGLDERFRNGGQGSYEGVLASHIVEDSRHHV